MTESDLVWPEWVWVEKLNGTYRYIYTHNGWTAAHGFVFQQQVTNQCSDRITFLPDDGLYGIESHKINMTYHLTQKHPTACLKLTISIQCSLQNKDTIRMQRICFRVLSHVRVCVRACVCACVCVCGYMYMYLTCAGDGAALRRQNHRGRRSGRRQRGRQQRGLGGRGMVAQRRLQHLEAGHLTEGRSRLEAVRHRWFRLRYTYILRGVHARLSAFLAHFLALRGQRYRHLFVAVDVCRQRREHGLGNSQHASGVE